MEHFWPVWLAGEDGLSSYRIFTFGYNSNFKGAGTNLNIIDFAKDLLFQMLVFSDGLGVDRIPIGRQPIIFVAHSMGGLVVKKAYVLGKHDGQYAQVISKTHGIVFLATPHRGAHYAKILNNILSTAPLGAPPKAYITDLHTHSRMLQDINEQFRTVCDDLSLISFFETLKTSFGVSKAIVVEKESSVLGYPQETSSPLNADHHTICKFKSQEDGNYISVRNILKLWASRLSSLCPPSKYPTSIFRFTLYMKFSFSKEQNFCVEPLARSRLSGRVPLQKMEQVLQQQALPVKRGLGKQSLQWAVFLEPYISIVLVSGHQSHSMTYSNWETCLAIGQALRLCLLTELAC